MIAKILSTRNECRATVSYAFGQTDTKEEYQSEEAYFLSSNKLTIPDPTVTTRQGSDGKPEVVQVPAQEAELDLVYEDMEEQAAKNNRAVRPFWHCVLSIGPEDEKRLGDIQLREVTHNFMSKMGYSPCRWVATVHRDTDHSHIHITACTVKEEPGNPVVNRYKEFQRAMEACRKIEFAFGLQETPMPTEGKAPSDSQNNPRLNQVRGILDWALLQELEQEQEPTLPGYLARAQDCGVECQIRWRKGKPAGVSFGFKGATFSATQLRAGGRYQLKTLQHHLRYDDSLKEELEAVHDAEPAGEAAEVPTESRDAVHEELRRAKADADNSVFISLSFKREDEARVFASHPDAPLPSHFTCQGEIATLFFQTDRTHDELEDPDIMKLVEQLMMQILELCRRILALALGLGFEGPSPGIERQPVPQAPNQPVFSRSDLEI